MEKVSDYFGCMVFDDRVMKANLSAEVYQSLRKTIDENARLDINVANAVAAAMKDWAVAHGATHYTLVPAAYRRHCGEARQLYLSFARRRCHHGIFGKRTDQGRA